MAGFDTQMGSTTITVLPTGPVNRAIERFKMTKKQSRRAVKSPVKRDFHHNMFRYAEWRRISAII
jgi:hypothetical protein